MSASNKPPIGWDIQLSRRRALQQLAVVATAAIAAPAQAATLSHGVSTRQKTRNPTMFAYVGCRTTRERNARGNGINVYRMDGATGAWTHVQLVDNLVNPSFLAFDQTQRYLYTVHGDQSEVSAFHIESGSGELTFLNRQNTGGKNPVHLAFDPSNRFLVIPNYGSGTLALLPRNADGSLGALADLVELPGKPGPHRVEQPHARPHFSPFDPKGRFIVVPDKGLDKVFSYRLDVDAGKLKPAETPSVEARETSGPRHITFHPRLPMAYVINELDSTVATYHYDEASGRLSPRQILSALPASFTGNSRASEIAIDASGRFVYASNRGHDSIALFAVDAASGLLSFVYAEPTQGRTPRFFALDPSGRFLYVANEDSDSIVTFSVDPHSGRLRPTGQMIHTGSPVCIVFSQQVAQA